MDRLSVVHFVHEDSQLRSCKRALNLWISVCYIRSIAMILDGYLTYPGYGIILKILGYDRKNITIYPNSSFKIFSQL